MAYTKKFVNPHPNGWDNPSERPPITADVLQAHTDAIQAIDNYLAAGGGGEGGGGSYELPIATSTILGGVKVDGETITITADGTISATAEGGAVRKTSDLINDGDGSGSRFVNQSELGAVALNNNYSSLDGKPSIPTKVSELTNDSKFLSEVPKASTTTIGGIKVDGEILNIASDGTLIFSGGTGGESYLADLKDTNITSLTDGQYLIYNKDSGKWINKTIEVEIPNLEELSNVNIETASLVNKDILTYNESTGEWENRAISTIPLNIYELADTSILPDMVQNGDVLTYNSESSTWVNQAIDLGAGSRELTLAEYDALTAEEKADGTDYYITDADNINPDSIGIAGSLKPWLYNSNKEVVIGVYDGKPLYRKMYYIAEPEMSPTTGTLITIAEIENVEKIISTKGQIGRYISEGSDILYYPINTHERADSYFFFVRPRKDIDTNTIYIEYLAYFNANSVKDLTITIEYTKTTDAENSGTNLMPYSFVQNGGLTRYSVFGKICDSDVDGVEGYGHAMITIQDNLAVIDYAYRITAQGTATDNFAWGLNPLLLQQLDNNIPYILPTNGGIIEPGTLNTEKWGYAPCNQATLNKDNDKWYWTPSRIHALPNSIGAWGSTTWGVDTYIKGTAYGTVL